jgi:hypothetical protein
VQCRWIAGNADRGEGEGISPGLKPDCPFSCPTGCSFPLNFQPEPNDPPTFVPKHPQTPRHGPRLFFSLLPCCCSHPLLAFSCLLIRQFSALRHPVALLQATPKACFPSGCCSITPQGSSVARHPVLAARHHFSPRISSATRTRTRGSPRCCLPHKFEQSACS